LPNISEINAATWQQKLAADIPQCINIFGGERVLREETESKESEIELVRGEGNIALLEVTTMP
jgi:hypothetical protein